METREPTPRTVYIVNELKWQWTDEWNAIQGDEPVKAFASRHAAEQHRLSLEQTRNATDLRGDGRTPNTESGIAEPFYEVVAVEVFE